MAKEMLGEAFGLVEPELRRDAYRGKIALATRPEMTRLLKDLRRHPERAEQVLTAFEAELGEDAERLEEESRYNSFDRRS